MASQRKKHTEAQLSGFYAYHATKECPACNSHKFKVIESRKTFEGTRRRYKCLACDYRQTMHEISAEYYEELRMLRSKFALIKNAVLDLVPDSSEPKDALVVTGETPEIPCSDCVHLTPYGCSFDIPEAQTKEAKGCNLFKEIF
jgi:DNA-binding ferritin-like protein (Dps family)